MGADVQVQVDVSAGALYVRLSDSAVHKTREFGDFRMVDYDADGHVVGVEFLQIATGVDLDGLPENPRILTVLLAHGFGGRIHAVGHIDTVQTATVPDPDRCSPLSVVSSGPSVSPAPAKLGVYRYADGALERVG